MWFEAWVNGLNSVLSTRRLYIIGLDNINKTYYINKTLSLDIARSPGIKLCRILLHQTFDHNWPCVGVKGCDVVGDHMVNDMLFDDFLTLPTFRNLVFLRPLELKN